MCVLCAVRRLAPLRHGRRRDSEHHVRGPARRRAAHAGGAPEPRAATARTPVPAHRARQRHGTRYGSVRQRRAKERQGCHLRVRLYGPQNTHTHT